MRLEKCDVQSNEGCVHLVLSRDNLLNLLNMLDAKIDAKIISYDYNEGVELIISGEEVNKHEMNNDAKRKDLL